MDRQFEPLNSKEKILIDTYPLSPSLVPKPGTATKLTDRRKILLHLTEHSLSLKKGRVEQTMNFISLRQFSYPMLGIIVVFRYGLLSYTIGSKHPSLLDRYQLHKTL